MVAPSGDFPPAMVIGLEGRYRGDPLEDDLRRRGFTVARIPGVEVGLDREGMPDPTLYDDRSARVVMRRSLTAGEVGCALAHRAAARALLASSHSAALVLEDDARLTPGWSAGTLPWPALDGPPTVITLFSQTDFTIGVAGTAEPVGDVTALWWAAAPPIGAVAYLMNRSAARILAADAPVRHVADWPPVAAASIRFGFLYPRLALPADDVASTLSEGRTVQPLADRPGTREKLLRHARAALHVTWFRSPEAYDHDYRAYLFHEGGRLFASAVARRAGRRLDADRGPWLLPAWLAPGRRLRA